MAYDDDELSTRRGKPRELYRFEGTYATYRYTSSTKIIRYQAPDEQAEHAYIPITLERSEVNAGTNNDDGLDLTVDLPVSSELAQAYAFTTSPPDLKLTVWRFHAIDDVRPYWQGDVTNLNIDNGVVTLTSPSSLGRAMTQQFPNVFYQAPCNHVLYDSRCKVLYDDWSTETEIYSVSDTTMRVLSNDKLAGDLAGALIGGEFVLPTGERRMIVTQGPVIPAVAAAGGQPAVPALVAIGINFPFGVANVGTSVTLAAGCDYAYTGDCKTKFANQLNFGGFPFIPEDNIFESSIDPGTKLEDNTCLPAVYDGVYMRVRGTGGSQYFCNPQWSGNRDFHINPQRPNGPFGTLINPFSLGQTAEPGVTNIVYEQNRPDLDPRLQGQALYKIENTDFNTWKVEFYCEVVGPFYVNIFPAARYCGSAATPKDIDGYGRLQVFVAFAGEPETPLGERIAGGNTDSHWDWG